jgi:hypothetical protein
MVHGAGVRGDLVEAFLDSSVLTIKLVKNTTVKGDGAVYSILWFMLFCLSLTFRYISGSTDGFLIMWTI